VRWWQKGCGAKRNNGAFHEEWIALVKKEGPKTRSPARVAEDQTQDCTNSAWWIAERAEGKGGDEDTPEVYLKAAVGMWRAVRGAEGEITADLR